MLHAIALTVPAGGRVAILGRNGAGKSTLFKSIMNAGPRVRGTVRWQGTPLAALPAYQRVRQGMVLVPEDRRIFTHLTVRENIEMSRYACSLERPAVPADTVLARIPMLRELAARPGGQLSGGQQQMLAVARALAARPRLMLLDEPAEGLAPVIVEQLAADVAAFCEEEGMALLLSEQNIWFARRCTTRVHVLGTGRVVFSGDWNEFAAAGAALERHLAV